MITRRQKDKKTTEKKEKALHSWIQHPPSPLSLFLWPFPGSFPRLLWASNLSTPFKLFQAFLKPLYLFRWWDKLLVAPKCITPTLRTPAWSHPGTYFPGWDPSQLPPGKSSLEDLHSGTPWGAHRTLHSAPTQHARYGEWLQQEK